MKTSVDVLFSHLKNLIQQMTMHITLHKLIAYNLWDHVSHEHNSPLVPEFLDYGEHTQTMYSEIFNRWL